MRNARLAGDLVVRPVRRINRPVRRKGPLPTRFALCAYTSRMASNKTQTSADKPHSVSESPERWTQPRSTCSRGAHASAANAEPTKRRQGVARSLAAVTELPPELHDERALDEAQTAALLGYARITLAQWRGRGEGPRFFRCGRSIRYRLGDVLAFRDKGSVG